MLELHRRGVMDKRHILIKGAMEWRDNSEEEIHAATVEMLNWIEQDCPPLEESPERKEYHKIIAGYCPYNVDLFSPICESFLQMNQDLLT